MNESDLDELKTHALKYLAQELGVRAPQALAYEGTYDEQPLHGEGRTALFSFELPREGAKPPVTDRHYVAVGETEPNFFPAFGLGLDDAYSYHIGSHFLLAMEVGVVAADAEPAGAREAIRDFVGQSLPDMTIGDERLTAVFRCDDQHFVVYLLTLGGEAVYCLGGDCPHGLYPLTQHPPQVALTLHLGKVIRQEAWQARRGQHS